jgi:hypothetical protein
MNDADRPKRAERPGKVMNLCTETGMPRPHPQQRRLRPGSEGVRSGGRVAVLVHGRVMGLCGNPTGRDGRFFLSARVGRPSCVESTGLCCKSGRGPPLRTQRLPELDFRFRNHGDELVFSDTDGSAWLARNGTLWVGHVDSGRSLLPVQGWPRPTGEPTGPPEPVHCSGLRSGVRTVPAALPRGTECWRAAPAAAPVAATGAVVHPGLRRRV